MNDHAGHNLAKERMYCVPGASENALYRSQCLHDEDHLDGHPGKGCMYHARYPYAVEIAIAIESGHRNEKSF